ncbi:MAG: hypothetical protein JWN40_3868 [Phycisphaerales bacterium]|nr:hypothetical protein [Phycisphaerales bacterium]
MKQSGPVVVTLVMLACLAGFSRLRIATDGVEEFRARSKQAVDGLPLQVGDWEGKRHELDPAARDLLKPNAEATLLYHNRHSNLEAYLAVVQVHDCRHMIGHTPAVCYPGNGWAIVSQTQRTWCVGEFDIPGIEYQVERPNAQGQKQAWTIQNFYIFPDGRFGATGAELNQAAADYRRLAYGAAQIQVVTATSMPEAVRQEIWRDLVSSKKSLEMIRTLRSGIPQ